MITSDFDGNKIHKPILIPKIKFVYICIEFVNELDIQKDVLCIPTILFCVNV